MIEKLLEELDYKIKDETPYMFQNYYVPRVSTILSTMIHEEFLDKWIYTLAFYKRKNYISEREKAAFIGTKAHECIENFLMNNLDFSEINKLSIYYQNKIYNCLESFIKWYSDIAPYNNIKIIDLEKELVCPYYGGTCDLLIEINGRLFLGDFKTSNNIGYKYFLQLSAYKYILENSGYKIDGCIILQVDKSTIAYEEYVLDFNNIDHKSFIDLCTNCFLSLVYSYYNKVMVENEFKRIFR